MHGGLTTAEAFPAESAGGLEQALARCAAINLPPREVNRSQHYLQPLHADKMTSKSLGPNSTLSIRWLVRLAVIGHILLSSI